jgi:hypothetical protein
MKLVQQSAGCSDFDVVLAGNDTPSFRVVLPEHIKAREYEERGGIHMIPGSWEARENGIKGNFRLGDEFEFRPDIRLGEAELAIELVVKNLMNTVLHDVATVVCTSPNHLPGDPGWCNRDFIPGVPVDRDLQGRFWYEKVTPQGLFALTDSGRVMMHPHPDNPDPDAVPKYSFTPSALPNAYACVARNLDGNRFFYQAWNVDCYWMTPCPGNACMHLIPVVAMTMKPGEESAARSIVGIHAGSEDDLIRRIESFRKSQR